VTVEDDDLHGQAVNAAARIAGKAAGGEIVVSEIGRRFSRPPAPTSF
jgi:class 3 adenylate cyclase